MFDDNTSIFPKKRNPTSRVNIQFSPFGVKRDPAHYRLGATSASSATVENATESTATKRMRLNDGQILEKHDELKTLNELANELESSHSDDDKME